ncbi:TPA: polysaccharide pyruvyl transferase family protein [Photobacterium damselae]
MKNSNNSLVTLYDTSVATKNVGDCIIMDAVKEHLYPLISNQIVTLPTHDSIGFEGLRILKHSEFSVVGGSNLLSSHLFRYNQWKFGFKDLYFLNHAVLMGVGWWQYQDKPDYITTNVYKRILNSNMIHSVRDDFTLEQLNSIGINNVINTSCATMWNLNKEHCILIPKEKSENVIFTLTDYNQDIVNDKKLIDILINNYEQVYFWPQGSGDLSYIKKISNDKLDKISIINSHLIDFDNILKMGNIDYIGTRLHAGIRALQNKCRTIIIGIDNRAKEKANDFNLLVIDRGSVIDVSDIIKSNIVTNIKLPIDNINKWKSQF